MRIQWRKEGCRYGNNHSSAPVLRNGAAKRKQGAGLGPGTNLAQRHSQAMAADPERHGGRPVRRGHGSGGEAVPDHGRAHCGRDDRPEHLERSVHPVRRHLRPGRNLPGYRGGPRCEGRGGEEHAAEAGGSEQGVHRHPDHLDGWSVRWRRLGGAAPVPAPVRPHRRCAAGQEHLCSSCKGV